MENNRLISVIVPCYNQGRYLNQCLESVLNQTYGQWECIIIDDGSTDDTRARGTDWVQKDNRFHYYFQENKGLSAARNAGLERMTGGYIQFLDADDTVEPDKFLLSIETKGDPDIVVSGFSHFIKDPKEQLSPNFLLEPSYLNYKAILTQWDVGFAIPIHCGLFKSFLFDRFRFDETLKAKEDWLMWLDIFKQVGIKSAFVETSLANYRLTENSMTKDNHLMMTNQLAAYRLIYHKLDQADKEVFFNKALNYCEQILKAKLTEIAATRNSASYRIGNFFVRRLNKLKGGS